MKSRPARLGVLLLAVVALLATMTPPASATTVKKIVFTGNTRTDKGLGYPCTTTKISNGQCPPGVTTTTKTGPKGEPELNITTTGGLHAGFDLSSNACVKVSASTPNKATPKNGVDLCLITATGVVWGWCGLSEMMGVATLVNLTSYKETITMEVKGTGIGGVIYIRGGNTLTNLYILATIIPTPPAPIGSPGAGSCTNKTGNVATIEGRATYKDITTT